MTFTLPGFSTVKREGIELTTGFTAVNAEMKVGSLEETVTVSQLDIRLAKVIQMGRARIQEMFDIYNVLNGNAVLGVNTRFGPTWLRPVSVQGARVFKFHALLDF